MILLLTGLGQPPPGLENFSQKSQIFNFFYLRVKKISSGRDKAVSALYLLWVRGKLSSSLVKAIDIEYIDHCLSSWKNLHCSKLMVYQQLNLCGLAGSAVGKPPLWFLVACVVYVFNVYDVAPHSHTKPLYPLHHLNLSESGEYQVTTFVLYI